MKRLPALNKPLAEISFTTEDSHRDDTTIVDPDRDLNNLFRLSWTTQVEDTLDSISGLRLARRKEIG